MNFKFSINFIDKFFCFRGIKKKTYPKSLTWVQLWYPLNIIGPKLFFLNWILTVWIVQFDSCPFWLFSILELTIEMFQTRINPFKHHTSHQVRCLNTALSVSSFDAAHQDYLYLKNHCCLQTLVFFCFF